jgi:hypothetical protein
VTDATNMTLAFATGVAECNHNSFAPIPTAVTGIVVAKVIIDVTLGDAATTQCRHGHGMCSFPYRIHNSGQR